MRLLRGQHRLVRPRVDVEVRQHEREEVVRIGGRVVVDLGLEARARHAGGPGPATACAQGQHVGRRAAARVERELGGIGVGRDRADDDRLPAAVGEEVRDGVAHRPVLVQQRTEHADVVGEAEDPLGRLDRPARGRPDEGGHRRAHADDRARTRGPFLDVDPRIRCLDWHRRPSLVRSVPVSAAACTAALSRPLGARHVSVTAASPSGRTSASIWPEGRSPSSACSRVQKTRYWRSASPQLPSAR